jgi:hypothetical protein
MSERELRLRTTDLAWRDVNGSVLLLDLRDSEYLELNRAGSLLWHRLDQGGAGQAALVDVLVEAYGLAVDQAEQDVKAFIALLEEADLLES